jgi:hypothetical protein
MRKFSICLAALILVSVLQGADKTKQLLSHDLVTADDLSALYKTTFAIREESNPNGAPFLKQSSVTYESTGPEPHLMVTVIFRQFSNGTQAYEAYKLTRGPGDDFNPRTADGTGIGETSCFTGSAVSFVRGLSWVMIAAPGAAKHDDETESKQAAQNLAKTAVQRLK